MATSTGSWSSVSSTEYIPYSYCSSACRFTWEMCGDAVEAASVDEELPFSDSDIDDMNTACDTIEQGCLDECTGESGYDALSARKPETHSSRQIKPKQRNHHYIFDIDDNDLDINGFIVHSDKVKGKRHKFRVFLDSNESGCFDKNDVLIGKTGLKQKHAVKGVGNLLDEDELGQLEVKFKKTKSNASMRESDDDIDTLSGGGGGSWINSLSFGDSDGDPISAFEPRLGVVAMADGSVRFIND